jgi:glutathione reductase (NADPH)
VFGGGGFIAMEFAHISKRAGAHEVTVLEMMDRPLGNFDPHLVEILCEATADLGIYLRTGAKVLRIEKNGADFTVAYETAKGVQTVRCDLVVHGTGRVPNIDQLNLEAAGVEYSRKGIKVSPFMRTTNKGPRRHRHPQ